MVPIQKLSFWLEKAKIYDANRAAMDCLKAGAGHALAEEVAQRVERYLKTTSAPPDKVKSFVFKFLSEKNPAVARNYRDKHGMYIRTSKETFEPFDRRVIAGSILTETGLPKEISERIACDVEDKLKKINPKYIASSMVREMVNLKMLDLGLEDASRNYRRLGLPVHDISGLILNGSNENANLQRNPETIHKLMADEMLRQYALTKVLHNGLADAHLRGLIHVHDLDYFATRPFCFSHDLRFFLKRGYVADGEGFHTAAAAPAKHANVAVLHAAKALASAQTNAAGGQGYNWFNVFLAPYVRGLSDKEIKQMAQMFVYEMSQMYVARGGQVVFSSIDLYPTVPKALLDVPAVVPGGKTQGVYGDYDAEARRVFNAFMDVYLEGDAMGKPFNFPKPEIVTTSKWMNEFPEEYMKVSQLSAKFGSPYYFVHQGFLPEMSCYQSLPYDEKVFVTIGDELKIVKIGEFVDGLMNKEKVERGKGLEGEVEVSEGFGFALSFNPETLKVEKRKIGKVMRHKTKEKIFRFILDTNRVISATAKHKIHVLRGDKIAEVRAEEITEGDCLIGLKNLEMDFSFRGEVEFKNKTMTIDNDFARLLGYFASEGCLHLANRKNRMNRVCFSFHEDETRFIEDVEKILGNKFGLNPKRDVSAKNKCVSVYVYDKSLAELFANALKTGHDAHSKRVPEKILSAPREIVKEFLLGLFRGDGYLKNTGKMKVDLHLCNKELIEDVFALSLRIGTPMDIFEGEKSYSLRLTSNRRMRSFLQDVPFAQLPGMPETGGMGGEPVRFFDFYDRIPVQPFRITRDDLKTGQWNRSQIGKRITMNRLEDADDTKLFRMFAESDLHLFEVKKIEEVESDYVYDFVNVDKHHNFANANGIFSSNCCAYLMPLSEQNTNDDLYEGSVRGGALQVTTINLPRVAYDADGNDDALFEILRERMTIARDVLEVKRKLMHQVQDSNLLPFMNQKVRGNETYLQVDKQSLVIGMVGLNEMVKYHTGKELHEDPEAWKFGLKVFNFMRKVVDEFSKETGFHYSLARTPAESCSQRLANIDAREFGDRAIVQGDRNTRGIYYTNGFHVRPSADIPLWKRMQIETSFHPICTGGVISHIWLGEAQPNAEALFELTKRLIDNTLVTYFAYTKDLSICKKCKMVAPGLQKTCSSCGATGSDMDWWSRITGYYQSVGSWNEAKKQELLDRKRYTIIG